MPKKGYGKIPDGLEPAELMAELAKLGPTTIMKKISSEFFRSVFAALYTIRNIGLQSENIKDRQKSADYFISLLGNRDMMMALTILEKLAGGGGGDARSKAQKMALNWLGAEEKKKARAGSGGRKNAGDVSDLVRPTP